VNSRTHKSTPLRDCHRYHGASLGRIVGLRTGEVESFLCSDFVMISFRSASLDCLILVANTDAFIASRSALITEINL
jgi:hypothetical protein